MRIPTRQILTRHALIVLTLGLLTLGAAAIKPASAQDAQSLYQRAVQGDISAMYRLGELYATGQGVPQDHAQAVKWFEAALVRDAASRSPQGAPRASRSAPTTAATTAAGRWSVTLGAFPSPAEANAYLARVRTNAGEIVRRLNLRVEARRLQDGAVNHYLLAQAPSQRDAQQVCGDLISRGIGCTAYRGQ